MSVLRWNLCFGCSLRAQVKHRWRECSFGSLQNFSSHVSLFFYFCQQTSQPEQSNNASADLPNSFPAYKAVKEPQKQISFHGWALILASAAPAGWIFPNLVLMLAGAKWLAMDICRLVCWQQTGVRACMKVTLPPRCLWVLLPVCLCDLWPQSKASSGVKSLLPPPTCCCLPLCNVASCLEPGFSWKRPLVALCIYIYCPEAPSADLNRLLKCSKRLQIVCVDCAKSLHKSLKGSFYVKLNIKLNFLVAF